MLIFLDESFRTHRKSLQPFGVLSGIAIPEEQFHAFQRDLFDVRKPYHGQVLGPDDEIKGKELLGTATFKVLEKKGYSYQWNLAEEILQYASRQKFKVFGVVCFRPGLHTFVCGDDSRLDQTFRDLFDRIDLFMKRSFPGRFAKLVFDNRDNRTNESNARAITNFFVKSALGSGYDSILRVPFFAASQGHNYGLQLADLVTTVIALKWQGENRITPLWKLVYRMLDRQTVGALRQSSLRVMGNAGTAQKRRDPAARMPMAGANPPSTESQTIISTTEGEKSSGTDAK